MIKENFIVVSNRLPVSVTKINGKLEFTPSSGGLATAMASLENDGIRRLWIGWPGIASDDLTPSEKSAITRKLRTFGCSPVFLTKRQIENFYNGYANDTLWPLFHYFQSLANYDDDYWAAYKEVSTIFKRVVIKHAAPNATIWIHDYHLMILPRQLRSALPGSTIGFFLHIPFPSYEIFRQLPNRKEVLEGLLGADLVGFHIYDYARHFLNSVLRILGIENSRGTIIMRDRVTRADAFPIGIDYQKFLQALKAESTQAELATLNKHYNGQKVILSMDRLDYSKGILKRLKAFDSFLTKNPHHHRKIVLVVIAVPSRTDVETYKDLRDEIERAIGRINGAHGTVDWTPISYQFKNLPFEQVLALFARADMALVTPLRDGMNLVAKEYVASKQQHPGVLILSEMAGAVDELPEALRINPNDINSIVQAIKTALGMPKKVQLAHMRSMQRRLSNYTVQRWAADFTEQLEQAKQGLGGQGDQLLSSEAQQKLLRRFQASHNRLILLDYDGTLRGFVSSHLPGAARPSRALLKLISELAELPHTNVCIVSGRTREVLEAWFGGLRVALAAEHGAWMKYKGEWSQQSASLHEHKKAILPILERYAERTPGARIEQKDFAIVWHYRNVPTELAHARNTSLRHDLNHILRGTDVSVYGGNKILEIKPRNIHKGAVAEDLLALHPSDFVLSIGDDYTDEDMFRSLPDDAYTIKVGLGDTRARYQLLSVDKVIQLLRALVQNR